MCVLACINLNDACDQGLFEVNHVMNGYIVAVVASSSNAVR